MRIKFTLVIVAVLIFFGIEDTYGQRIYGALSAGVNLSQVDGDEVYGFNHVGFNGGPSVILPFGKKQNWSVTLEILFSQLGAKQKSQYVDDSTNMDSTRIGLYDGYKLNLNYVQIPLLVHFTDKNIISGGFGFLYGQNVGVSEMEEYNDARGWIKADTLADYVEFNKADFQVIADVRFRIWQRFWLDLRYSYSLVPIRTRTYQNPITLSTWTRKQYNNVIALRLTYIFNQPLLSKAERQKNKVKSE